MAKIRWTGLSMAVAQVNTETPATVEIGDIFAVRLSDKSGNSYEISFTATAATVQNVVEGLKALAVAAATAAVAPWNAVTCTEDDTAMTITADTAGEPFWVSTTATDGGGADTQTLTDASVTAVKGPNIYNDPQNWSGYAVPIAADDVVVPRNATSAIYGYDASSVNLDSFEVEEGCVIAIGAQGRYLDIELGSAKTMTLGGTGLTYVNATCSDNNGVITVAKCGSSGGAGAYSTYIKGAGFTTLDVNIASSERLGLAMFGGETATYTTINILNGVVGVGDGVTATTLNVSAGTVDSQPAITNVNMRGGILHLHGAAGTGLIIYAGTVYDYINGTHASVDIRADGVMDCTKDLSGRTYLLCEVRRGSNLNDPFGTITFGAGIDFIDCDLGDATVKHGQHRTWTPTAV